MENSVRFWNECHERYDNGRLKEETCWDRYAGLFTAEKGPVLDLACGTGSDSVWLKNHGIPSVACDYSPAGLKLFHSYLPEIPVLCFDMTNTFPFPDETFGSLICDMGLHFFPRTETVSILKETRRILKKGGNAFFRVNAAEDLEPEKIIDEIEPFFYSLKDDVNKRYFTRDEIDRFFADWTFCEAERTQMTRYGTARETWLLRCRN